MPSPKTNFVKRLLNLFPVFFLLFLAFSETNFNFEKLNFLSFNLIHIIIFYWVLKNPDILGYGFIFIAGLINDVVLGLPMGISSLAYLLICGFAAYLKNITLRPSLIKDWIFFLLAILVVNSLIYTLLFLFFSYPLDYNVLIVNLIFTFLLYFFFAYVFQFYHKLVFRNQND